jgi:hypothetical protein
VAKARARFSLVTKKGVYNVQSARDFERRLGSCWRVTECGSTASDVDRSVERVLDGRRFVWYSSAVSLFF